MNFESLNCFLLFKTNRNGFKNPGTVLGLVRPGAMPTGMAACHARSADKPTGPWPGSRVQSRRWPVARERAALAGRATTRWRVCRWLGGGWSAARLGRGAQGGSPKGVGGRRGWWAHRGNGSTGGGGAEAARRCSRVVKVLR
jgi:hypothetical protein